MSIGTAKGRNVPLSVRKHLFFYQSIFVSIKEREMYYNGRDTKVFRFKISIVISVYSLSFIN